MVREDTVTMSPKELRRVHVIRQVREKRITREAGTLLGLTDRQIRRLLRRVEQEGDQGLVHRRWRWRNWPSSMGSPSATKPCWARA
jgi:hypothetical protein